MTPRDSLLAVLVMAIWGFNFVAAKLSMAFFDPLFLMAIRFAVVAALLLPFATVPRGRMLGIAVLAFLLGGLHFPLIFAGVRGVDAGTAAVVIQLQVPFSSLLAAVLYKDVLGWRRFAGMLVAFAGVVLVAGAPRLSGGYLHLGLVVAAALAFAVANVQIKRIGAIDGITMNAWMALFAVPQVLALSLLLEDGQWRSLWEADATGWAALGFTIVGSSIVAYGLWYRLARVYPVNQTVPFLLLVPPFGVLSGVLALDEPLTLNLVVGGLMTVAGVAVILIRWPQTVNEKATNTT